MKKSFKLLLAVAVAVLAVSCVKELVPQDPEECVLVATFDGNDPETKTAISSDNKLTWVLNDKIGVVDGSSRAQGIASRLANNDKTAYFTMSKALSSKASLAAYPYGQTAIHDNSYVLFMDYDSDGSFAKANLCYGKVINGTIRFHNAAAIFKIQVNRTDVRKITISAQEDISNFYLIPTLSSSGALTSVSAYSTGTPKKYINLPVSGTGTYYVAVPAGSYGASSFTFDVLNSSGATIKKYTYPKALTLKMGDLIDWGDLLDKSGKATVSSVGLNKTSLTLPMGSTETLKATVNPGTALIKDVTWSSSNTSVLTVDANGKLTPKKPGKATVTVKTKDGSKTATCEVSVVELFLSINRADNVDVKAPSIVCPYNKKWMLSNGKESYFYVKSTDGTKVKYFGISNSHVTVSFSNSAVLSSSFSTIEGGTSPVIITTIKSSGATEMTVKIKDDNGADILNQKIMFDVFEPTASDLGLSVGWAIANLGAGGDPYGSGRFFAWGETEPKSSYNENTYFDTTDGGKTYNKYNKAGQVLDLEDDAAHQLWGGCWRMPTMAEWRELEENCTWSWRETTSGTLKFGGYNLTSNKNGGKLYLIEGGYYDNATKYSYGETGEYWASDLKVAINCGLYEITKSRHALLQSIRYRGVTVRAVYDPDLAK